MIDCVDFDFRDGLALHAFWGRFNFKVVRSLVALFYVSRFDFRLFIFLLYSTFMFISIVISYMLDGMCFLSLLLTSFFLLHFVSSSP